MRARRFLTVLAVLGILIGAGAGCSGDDKDNPTLVDCAESRPSPGQSDRVSFSNVFIYGRFDQPSDKDHRACKDGSDWTDQTTLAVSLNRTTGRIDVSWSATAPVQWRSITITVDPTDERDGPSYRFGVNANQTSFSTALPNSPKDVLVIVFGHAD